VQVNLGSPSLPQHLLCCNEYGWDLEACVPLGTVRITSQKEPWQAPQKSNASLGSDAQC
jgi:hypothetical protein